MSESMVLGAGTATGEQTSAAVILDGVAYICFYTAQESRRIDLHQARVAGVNVLQHLAGSVAVELIGLIEDQLLTDMASLRVPASTCAEAR